MTKVDKTVVDAQGAIIAKQAQEAKSQANTQFVLGYHTIIIGVLAHMVRDAQKVMKEVPDSSIWRLLGKSNSWAPTILKWSGYSLGAISLVSSYVYKQEQKKAEKKITSLKCKQQECAQVAEIPLTELQPHLNPLEDQIQLPQTVINSCEKKSERVSEPLNNITRQL